MNLWRPAIWTPMAEQRRRARRGQYWRRRLFDPLRFAAGDVLLDTSGNVILDASGNVMLSDGAGDDCCCGGEGCCAGDADQLEVSFIGITNCAATCAQLLFGSIQLTTLNLGTYTVTRDPSNPCYWEYLQDPAVDIAGTYYPDSASCTGTAEAITQLKVAVSRTYVLGLYWMQATATAITANSSVNTAYWEGFDDGSECIPAGGNQANTSCGNLNATKDGSIAVSVP